MEINPTYSTLFVCTANQCRSPMAEALLRKYLLDNGFSEEKWKVGSAGCWAYPGMPATQKAIQAANLLDADLYFHESQAVTETLLDDFNLILCMETGHIDFINRHFPRARQKVFLLTEMVNKDHEIDDPVGKTQADYQNTAENLLEIFRNGFIKIKKLSE